MNSFVNLYNEQVEYSKVKEYMTKNIKRASTAQDLAELAACVFQIYIDDLAFEVPEELVTLAKEVMDSVYSN